MKKYKKYSQEVEKILNESRNPSLSLILEEESEESEDQESEDQAEDSGESEESESPSFDFNDENEQDPEDSDNTESTEPEPVEAKSDSISVEDLEKLLNQYTKDLTIKFTQTANRIEKALDPDSQSLKKFSNARNENNMSYYKKSINNFLFEEDDKENSSDDLEKLRNQIETISDLADLIDDRFNRPTALVTWEDIPYVVEKSMELINTHDPVKYAYEQSIRYLDIKTDASQTKEIKDEFNRLFNEKCKESGIESPELVTNLGSIDPVKYKTAMSGNTTG